MAPLPTVDRLRAIVEPAPAQVLAAYLFGSFARGTASADSDIDLGLLLAEPSAGTLDGRMLDYEAQLEREFSRPVQVVILNDAPPDLAHRVLRDGRVLLDRDRATRLRWEVHARNMYFDLLPALTSYRKRARARVDAAMTDRALVEKKLAAVVSAVSDLRRLARLELLRHDVREERFIEHTLQLAVQAALDVASHIVSDESLGEPATNRELFDLLARAAWIDGELAVHLSRMAGFRNVLVHGYDQVDLGIVEDVVRHRLDDLLRLWMVTMRPTSQTN